MAYLVTITLIIAYGYLLIRWEKLVSSKLGEQSSKIIKYIHYVGLAVVVTVGVSYGLFDHGLRGLWTTRIFMFLTLLTGCFYRFLSSPLSVNKFERLYFKVVAFVPVMLGGIFLIPLLGIVLILSLGGQLIEPAEEIYYQDSNLRIQSTFMGVLGPPRVEVFEKALFFRKAFVSVRLQCFRFQIGEGKL